MNEQFTDPAIILGNCTTHLPLKLDLHDGDVGHTVIMSQSCKGMSVFQGFLDGELQKAGAVVAIVDVGPSSYCSGPMKS